ncbi:MAG: hypothetical protein HYX32_15135 [Actinobacteria bacterium]|nr:hypothetical protein [Actinomycetota bacterium]
MVRSSSQVVVVASVFDIGHAEPACVAAGFGMMIRDPETKKVRYEGLRIHECADLRVMPTSGRGC